MKRLLLALLIVIVAGACAAPSPPDLQREMARSRQSLQVRRKHNLNADLLWKAWRVAVYRRALLRQYEAQARALARHKAVILRAKPKPRVFSVYVPSAPPAVPARAVPVERSNSCGGSLPPCYVLARESGGNPRAENPTSTASGLWQFLDSTWQNFGGYHHASDAPVSVQNERARIVWANGAGASNWACC